MDWNGMDRRCGPIVGPRRRPLAPGPSAAGCRLSGGCEHARPSKARLQRSGRRRTLGRLRDYGKQVLGDQVDQLSRIPAEELDGDGCGP
jgi:hypothetical protein